MRNRNLWNEKEKGEDNAPIKGKILTERQRSLQYKDKQLVEQTAEEIGLKVGGFQTNDELEIYYVISNDKKDICYISKGWGDPGFRVGEYIEIDKGIPCFKEKFYGIYKACAGNLISVDVSEATPNKVLLCFQIGLYQKGFNEEVLTEAIDSLEDTLQKIRAILKS